MKLAAVLVLVAPFILGETIAVSHLRCGGVEYELPQVDSARANCLDKSNTVCTIHCIFVHLNVLNKVNNRPNLDAMNSWISSVPKGLLDICEPIIKGCVPLAFNLPSRLDATCSEYEPYVSCTQKGIAKHCKLLAPSVFS